jgi:nucleoside-diphosphate-sugar epimerase
MRIAVAGAGSFTKHFAEELLKAGLEVVILTRSHKTFDVKLGVLAQRITDYSSVEELTEQIGDCDALVSTMYDLSQAYVDVHEALVEACKHSPKCKRFVPSEFGGNSEDYPEQPGSTYQFNLPVKEMLRAQSELEWSVISIGWLLDYVVPQANRYHIDIGPFFALDLNTETMTIPGTGHEKFVVTSARDIAVAVSQMLKSPNKWRPFTYVQAEETTSLKIAETMRTSGNLPNFKVEFVSVAAVKAAFEREESMESMALAEFQLCVPSGKLQFDQQKVQRDHAEFFPDVHFCTVKGVVEAVQADQSLIM